MRVGYTPGMMDVDNSRRQGAWLDTHGLLTYGRWVCSAVVVLHDCRYKQCALRVFAEHVKLVGSTDIVVAVTGVLHLQLQQ